MLNNDHFSTLNATSTYLVLFHTYIYVPMYIGTCVSTYFTVLYVMYIFCSLSALSDVLAALAQHKSHVPYRNSTLTQLLKSSIGLYVCVWYGVHNGSQTNLFSDIHILYALAL